MNITINALELASELAHDELVRTFTGKIYMSETDGITYYTEEAQDIFNELYDNKLDYLELFKL